MNNKKSIFITVLVLLLVVTGGLMLMKNTGFRVISQDPEGDIAMSSTLVGFTLSNTPVNKDEIKYSLKPEVKGSFELKDNKLIFKPAEAFKQDVKYTVSIENVKLTDSNSIHNTKHTFKAIYIPYDKLPQDEKDRQLAKTNPHYETYPITKVLPYTTSTYKIEYSLPVTTEKLLLIITPLIEQGRGESTEQYEARLLAIKAESEQYITSRQFKLSDYSVYYPDLFLMEYSTALPNSDE